ncbi:hypothetical protein ABH926_006680 [Catenulispora sp. GP43]|uniref:hypothetical protein n=1 Tax=Catenulispora sp. GP43 TaxID=3156263 RepID=UPI003510D4EA
MSLAALGMDGVPALDPLSYPGRLVDEPELLCGAGLLPMVPSREPMGRWRVNDGASDAQTLDEALVALDLPPAGERHPVIAVGSNGAPGQLHHKLSRLGLPAVVPMTPLRVSGLGVGVSAHVGLNGYVANSPFLDPECTADVVLTLLDSDQLRAVDDTELPRYRRVLLPAADLPMVLPSGEHLDAAYLYVNATGVLAGSDGTPLHPGPQAALLAELLDRSPRLRELFDSPQDWVTKARADANLRAAAKRIFHDEGWVLPQDAWHHSPSDDPGTTSVSYAELSPLATGRDHP